MQKYIVILIVIIVLGGVGYYYDRYIRFGSPTRESAVEKGFFFEGAQSERTFIYEKGTSKYDVTFSEFSSEENARAAFTKKLEHYRLNTNGGVVREDDTHIFIVEYTRQGIVGAISRDNKNIELELEGTDENVAAWKQFINWFLRYH